MSTYATTSLEIEIGINGTYDGPDRSVGCPGGWVDHEVEDIAALVRNPDPDARKANYYIPKSLMKGVDVRSKDIQQLFANILEHCDLEAWASEAADNQDDGADHAYDSRRDDDMIAQAHGKAL